MHQEVVGVAVDQHLRVRAVEGWQGLQISLAWQLALTSEAACQLVPVGHDDVIYSSVGQDSAAVGLSY